MNDREKIVHALTELADGIMLAKGKDYTAGNWDTDPNYNFNAIAELLKGAPITPYTVCMIYFLKHVFSLIKFCKTGTQEGGEGLEGRHVDALNYVRILWSLVVESKKREEAEYAVTWNEPMCEPSPMDAVLETPDPSEVERITGIDPRDLASAINFKNKGPMKNCECPTCKRMREREFTAAQDWLDRVNDQFNNNISR